MVDWMRKLLAACLSCKILPGIGYKVRQTTSGTVLEIVPGNGKASSGPQAYRFKSMQDDYLVCRTWDGTTEGATDVNVAKPTLLRFSLSTRTVAGQVLTFSQYNLTNQTRISMLNSSPELEVIIDRYEVDDVIYAQAAETFVEFWDGSTVDDEFNPVLTSVALIDLNIDGRYWGSA